jgi:hypothetical protein
VCFIGHQTSFDNNREFKDRLLAARVIVVDMLFDLIGWLLADLIGNSVARVLFPLLSFGRVTVQPSGFDDTFRSEFNHLGYRRDWSGRIQVSGAVAVPIGLLFCLAAAFLITVLDDRFLGLNHIRGPRRAYRTMCG